MSFRVPTVYTHITLLLLCVTYDDVGVVSSTHSLHPHHFKHNISSKYFVHDPQSIHRPKQGQQHTLLKCVVVGTRNNTHNTIQQHTLLKCFVVGTRHNTHNTIQQHILLKCVVVGTRNNTHNTIQQHTLLMLLLCVTYDDVGVVSSTHSLHPHHFVVVCHLWWCGCCFEYQQFTPHHFNNTLC